ncbi:hypothetical protein [Kitasatospora sp. NPDC093806]|uniref:hypothetical protein n=1 Tax=Kitasatospora sp. NPDC093806 TaxID=3155075 RepID=UPI00343C9302
MEYTVSATVLLGLVIVVRLRRRAEARGRLDEGLTVLSGIVFGVLIAATPWGRAVLDLVGAAARATR